MKAQNYKNHSRIVFTYHIFTLLAIVALLIGSLRNVMYSTRANLYSAWLIVLVALILLSLYIHSRVFALKAQDRAIRVEESLRYFILTGKPLDHRLTLGQIIALRFASDEEMPALAEKAVTHGLSNDDIKKQIRVWRMDVHRV